MSNYGEIVLDGMPLKEIESRIEYGEGEVKKLQEEITDANEKLRKKCQRLTHVEVDLQQCREYRQALSKKKAKEDLLRYLEHVWGFRAIFGSPAMESVDNILEFVKTNKDALEI